MLQRVTWGLGWADTQQESHAVRSQGWHAAFGALKPFIVVVA